MDGCIFDREIDRKGSHSLKFDFAKMHGQREDALPMWIADMDFSAPECVITALQNEVQRGTFGYGEPLDSYYDAVISWFKNYHGWEPKREWLIKTPGIVFALATAVQAFTEKGDGILIQPPVYYPFSNVIRNNGRVIVESPLVYENGRYSIDFEDFEKKASREDVKLFILCSPHNPVGRVWTEEELKKIGAICKKYGLKVVSDEIHCDFAIKGHKHNTFCAAVADMAENACVCTAASKTFNIAGLQLSNIWIPGKEMREAFIKAVEANGYTQPPLLGIVACEAAYKGGREWLLNLKDYLYENLNYVRTFLNDNIPEIKLVEPDGMYFAWIDCSGLGLTSDELENFISQKALLWLDSGKIFGKIAEQFQRVVLACPRSTVQKAMNQLKAAVDELREGRK